MSDILTRYKNLDYTLPDSYLSWDLFGAGLDNLGRNGKAVELPLREPNPDEVLLRVDALGLCFSDTKLIWAGPEHPRIRGRDLQNDPTVAGHEAALTVIKAGSNWSGKFEPGQRFIVQADIFINGEQKAYGYVQRGAMAQYTYAGPWVLDGDDGCYLLPIKNATGYAEAALVEPWACVEAAYHIKTRSAPKSRGRLLVVFASEAKLDCGGVYADGVLPAFTAVLGKTEEDLVSVLGSSGFVKSLTPTRETIEKLVTEETGEKGFDDIFLVGDASTEIISACDNALGKDGVLAFVSSSNLPATSFDIGRIHYHFTRHVGTTGSRVMDAYAANPRSELAADGATWMIGAAGPMGQMHVQRALELDSPPKHILCTDISAERMEYMRSRLQPLADKKGIVMTCLDVTDPSGLEAAIAAATGGSGFDDVYVHAPVAPLVEQGATHLGMNSVLNIFAGVALGTQAKLAPSVFTDKHSRIIGSSGSSIDEIKEVLDKMESGRLATRMSLAALGGIEATWKGIKGVKEGLFPGKTVIYPQIRGLELLAAEDVGTACPDAADKMEPGGVWTNSSEDALLEKLLDI